MNRRDALAALTGLPMIASISVARLRPRDVIVIECPGMVTDETAERMRAYVKQIWPDHHAVVLGDGVRLKVVSGE